MYDIFERLLAENNCKAADVAKATGIHPSTFSDWKSGKSKPKQDKMVKIANFFHIPLDYLLGEVDVRLDHASVLSDMNAFSRYLKELGWNVIFNKEPHQEGYYTLRSEQLTVNISIEQYNDFENRIRNDCVDSILTFVTEAFNNGKSVSLLAARPNDAPDAGDSDFPEDDQSRI